MSETPDTPLEQQPEPRAIAPAAVGAPPIEPEGQRLRITILALGVVLILSAVALWPSHWGGREIIGLAAIVITVAVSCILAYQLAQLLIDEPISEVWRVLRGEPLGLRSKQRFLTRLQHECSDAQVRARNREFSLAVFAVDASDEVSIEIARDVVRRSIRARDVASELAAGEMWVLALGAGPGGAEAMTARLRDALAAALPTQKTVAVGTSTFNDNAFSSKQMIAVARQRAGLIDAQVAAELKDAEEQHKRAA